MKTKLGMLLILIISIITIPVAGIITETSDNAPQFAEERILVKFSDDYLEEVANANSAFGTSVITDYSTLGMTGLELVSLHDELSVEDAISQYEQIPGCEYAEPDYVRRILKTPKDPEFCRQWGSYNTGQAFKPNISGIAGADIKSVDAWDKINGSNVIVAVVDTEIDYLHPDLTANMWTNPETGNHGFDTIINKEDPMDLNSHGTHCAGIIRAVANNDIGGTGVNWNANIMGIRSSNSYDNGYVSDEIE